MAHDQGLSVSLDAGVNESGPRRRSRREVLLVGDMSTFLRAELSRRGATLTLAEALSDGFVQLSERSFDVIVVNPLTDGCGQDFVDCLKEDDEEHLRTVATLYGARGNASFLLGVRPPSEAGLEALRAKVASVPFVVLPRVAGGPYSVVSKTPREAQRLTEAMRTIVTTVMSIEPAATPGLAS